MSYIGHRVSIECRKLSGFYYDLRLAEKFNWLVIGLVLASRHSVENRLRENNIFNNKIFFFSGSTQKQQFSTHWFV